MKRGKIFYEVLFALTEEFKLIFVKGKSKMLHFHRRDNTILHNSLVQSHASLYGGLWRTTGPWDNFLLVPRFYVDRVA